MSTPVIQSSLAAGELSQNLFARVDLDKYQTGAALMRNFFVDYRGGASTRPGTAIIDRAKFANTKARLIPFIFSQQQSYVLELGDHYMRFFSNGGALLKPATAITAITRALPAVVTSAGHGLTTGDDAFIDNVLGMLEIDGGTYSVTVIDANHVSLSDLDGNPIDSSAFTPYVSGGTLSGTYEITTPWDWEDLPLLKFTQSADVMTFTHVLYNPQDLIRTGASTFALSAEVIGPTLGAPTIAAATPTDPGNLTYQYVVSAATANGERGTPSAILACNSKALNPTPTAGAAISIEITFLPVTDADHYDIFKTGPTNDTLTLPTYFGYIGSTNDIGFTDSNVAPDYTNGPPQFRNPFASSNHPGCVTYYQQRRVYGGLAFSPEELDFSKTGAYLNFDNSFGVLDSDAIQIAIASRQVNEIKSMVPTSTGLVVLTTGGAFLISGGTPLAAVTPSDISALPQASSGVNDMPPIVVNYDILFVQSKGSIVRDLAFNFYTQSFYGFDRSALANHLFFGQTLLEWAWAEEPFKIVWVTRSDGRLLSLTYVPEQEVYGWAQHYTQGAFESVCVVPEGNEDAVYFIVQRPNGQNTMTRWIERMASRHYVRVEDVWCVDCGVKRQLAVPGFGLTVSANDTTAFMQAKTGTPFDLSWIGKILWFNAGGKIRVTTLLSPSQINGDILEPLGNRIPATEQYFDVEAGAWEGASEVTTISNLPYAEGTIVQVFADGEVLGEMVVPASKTLELANPACKILVGLGYTCDLQTLYLDTGEPTIQGKRKQISAVTIRMDQSRGLASGGTFEDLIEFKELPTTGYTPPLPLVSRDERITIAAGWTEEGQVCIQQKYPLPATVLGIIPEVEIGDDPT